MKTPILALIIVLFLLGAADRSDAAPRDTRPCATPAEVWGIGQGGFSRAQVEKRWEVTGQGTRVYDPMYGRIWIYPLCNETERVGFAQFQKKRLVGVGIIRYG